MSEADDTDEREDEQTVGAFDELYSGANPELSDSNATPADGRVMPTGETESVLDRIEEMEETEAEPFPHGEPGEVSYIPVGDSMMPYLERRSREGEGFDVGGKHISWWRDDSVLPKHPYMLLNPTTLANRNYHYNQGIVRDFIQAQKSDVWILADSGGFQLVNSGLKVADDVTKHDWDSYIHPERVVEWQIANSDAGTVLDVPVYNKLESDDDDRAGNHGGLLTDQYGEWVSEVMQPRKEMTREHSKQASDRVDEIDVDNFTLVGVLHGMPCQDGRDDFFHSYREWYEALEDQRDWRAWSLSSPYEGRVGAVSALLGFASQHMTDVDFLHVLGQGNVWARVIGKLYAQEMDTFVTMDGTGFKIGSMYSTMYLPSTYMKSMRMTNRDEQEDDSRYETLKAERMMCGCAVCRQVETHIGGKELFKKPGTERSVLMDLHNLNHLIRRFYLIDSFVAARGRDLMDEVEITWDDRTAIDAKVNPNSEFWRLLMSWYNEAKVAEIYYAMDFLLLCIDGKVDEATEKYTLNTPFNDYIANRSGNDNRGPSIWRDFTKSVYDWT